MLPILVPIESSCNFLLVNNTNLHPISHCFRVIADYWSYLRFQQGAHTHSGWTPKFRTTEFWLQETRTTTLSYGIDILTDDYFILSQCMRLTDRQTDVNSKSVPNRVRCSLKIRQTNWLPDISITFQPKWIAIFISQPVIIVSCYSPMKDMVEIN